jgi:NAD-dependent deacetylase
MNKKKLLVFTGAGIDKESGIETFRDSNNGLWNNYKVENVASLDGWYRDMKKVLDFYNDRRRELKEVVPNIAHNIISDLEKYFDVTVVTQNVTDLHERSGSTNVIHLHGELLKSKSTFPDSYHTYNCVGDINIGDNCENGYQLRPNITWFGEELDAEYLSKAIVAAEECDLCIVVGTSMQVFPASKIPFLSRPNAIIWIVDPNDIDIYIDKQRRPFIKHIKEKATIGMQIVKDELKSII